MTVCIYNTFGKSKKNTSGDCETRILKMQGKHLRSKGHILFQTPI